MMSLELHERRAEAMSRRSFLYKIDSKINVLVIGGAERYLILLAFRRSSALYLGIDVKINYL